MISKIAILGFLAAPFVGLGFIEYDWDNAIAHHDAAMVALIEDIDRTAAQQAKSPTAKPVAAVKPDPAPTRTIALADGVYRKVGRSEIWFCHDYASAANSVIEAKRTMLSMRADCYQKTLEFEYRYIDRAFLWGPSQIEVSEPIEHLRKWWILEQDLRKYSVGG